MYMIRDLVGKDWFGGFKGISDSIEGPFAWTETLSRSRLPPRRVIAETPEGGWQLKTTALMDRATAKERHGVSFALWVNERKIGVPILWARTSSGFEDTSGAKETLPLGWKLVIHVGVIYIPSSANRFLRFVLIQALSILAQRLALLILCAIYSAKYIVVYLGDCK